MNEVTGLEMVALWGAGASFVTALWYFTDKELLAGAGCMAVSMLNLIAAIT